MALELKPSSKALVARTKEEGVPLSAAHVLRKPLPNAKWWDIVSRSAKSGQPYYSALKELAAFMVAEPTFPPWPEGLFEDDATLPPITQSEAFGLLDRFLRAEKGKIQTGVQIHTLHWDVLAAHYCPLRERYPAIKELTAAGFLLESAGTPLHLQSNLHWPLTTNEQCTHEIGRVRLDARLPTLRRLEDFLQNLSTGYPILTKAVLWLLIGGGAVKAIEWVLGLITRP
jgi:hypothetical protein